MTPASGLPRLVGQPDPYRPSSRERAAPVQETRATMTSLHSRLAAAALALAIAAALVGASGPAKVIEPNKLIILSTNDVKGENEPCG